MIISQNSMMMMMTMMTTMMIYDDDDDKENSCVLVRSGTDPSFEKKKLLYKRIPTLIFKIPEKVLLLLLVFFYFLSEFSHSK